jgi:hypothetical protein
MFLGVAPVHETVLTIEIEELVADYAYSGTLEGSGFPRMTFKIEGEMQRGDELMRVGQVVALKNLIEKIKSTLVFELKGAPLVGDVAATTRDFLFPSIGMAVSMLIDRRIREGKTKATFRVPLPTTESGKFSDPDGLLGHVLKMQN